VFGVQVDHGGEIPKVASRMRFHQVPSFVMAKDENSRKNMES
jgi:hypothetical protein